MCRRLAQKWAVGTQPTLRRGGSVARGKEAFMMACQYISSSVARLCVLACSILVFGGAACSGQAVAPTPVAVVAPTATPVARGPMSVRAGKLGVLGEAGELLAHSQGYFAQQELTIEFVNVDPSTVIAALTSGQIDIAGLGVDAALFNAIQRGVDLRIVAALAASEPQANGAFLVVRKDLIDSGKIRTYADLKGLNIGIPGPASSAEYLVARTMEAGGLALSDAHLVVLNFPAMVAGLGTQAIDLGVLPEPLATVAVQNGSGVKWKGIADVVPGFQQTVVAYNPRFAAQRDPATRWMTAYLHGVRDYNDAFRKNVHRPQTVEILAGALSIEPTLFDGMGFMHIHPDGKVNLASMEEVMRWYVKMGYLSSPVDVARSVDRSFAEAAVTELGPYQ